ncbi:uncharacterized protein LOC111023976 [Momordica charantia]|uniref:Uncharacterized protein LOC111023976 n=1 Tax=Momordica charantia TaxID=3673 RepID=A0A6J1DVV3_MOMCH|nr:uncharacterized protein LOC111023976 [Momordica charantia]
MTEELCLSFIFFNFFSLIFSHPLYFFYLLFFSPYLLKLLFFLSPLLTTTSLSFLLIPSFPLPRQDDLHHYWLNLVFEEPVREVETKAKDITEVIPNKEGDRSHSSSSCSSRKKQIKQRDEWRRRSAQLSFKFFEDHYDNNNKDDEMDLLWEMYEAKESKMGELVDDSKRGDDNSKKKDLRSLVNEKEAEEGEEAEEEEIGKICCLQALKFSTGKMRLGIGKRSGLTKISKAFKGLKFLHHLNNHGKKNRHS